VANAKVPADVVYKLLSKIYTPEGLAHMVNQKKTFKAMSIETGVTGIVTPCIRVPRSSGKKKASEINRRLNATRFSCSGGNCCRTYTPSFCQDFTNRMAANH
jgi:hypothetical protein